MKRASTESDAPCSQQGGKEEGRKRNPHARRQQRGYERKRASEPTSERPSEASERGKVRTAGREGGVKGWMDGCLAVRNRPSASLAVPACLSLCTALDGRTDGRMHAAAVARGGKSLEGKKPGTKLAKLQVKVRQTMQ